MHGFEMSEWGGHMMSFGWIGLLLLIVVFIYFMNNNNKMHNKNDEPSARDILDKRYANGEIDDEEYKRKRDKLH